MIRFATVTSVEEVKLDDPVALEASIVPPVLVKAEEAPSFVLESTLPPKSRLRKLKYQSVDPQPKAAQTEEQLALVLEDDVQPL